MRNHYRKQKRRGEQVIAETGAIAILDIPVPAVPAAVIHWYRETLELDLWNALERARQFPETMDVRPLAGISKSALCDALEHAIVDQPLAEQLRVVAEGIEQLVGVYAECADYLIDGYERRHNPQEPMSI